MTDLDTKRQRAVVKKQAKIANDLRAQVKELKAQHDVYWKARDDKIPIHEKLPKDSFYTKHVLQQLAAKSLLKTTEELKNDFRIY